jgi:hypothetical protein
MKKVFLALALVIVISLVSCRKSESVVEPTTTDSTTVAVDSITVDSTVVDTTAVVK